MRWRDWWRVRAHNVEAAKFWGNGRWIWVFNRQCRLRQLKALRTGRRVWEL